MSIKCLKQIIFEIRYEAATQIFDRRGVILDKVWTPFKTKLPKWEVGDAAVSFKNEKSWPQRTIHIDHMRTFISYSGCDLDTEFADDSKRMLRFLFDALPEIKFFSRVGCRCVIFHGDDQKDLKYFSSLIKGKWLSSTPPISIPFNDCMIIADHENGRIAIGAVKPEDKFIERHFPGALSDGGIISNGISIDVDSYVRGVERKSTDAIGGLFTSVYSATAATVAEVMGSVGI